MLLLWNKFKPKTKGVKKNEVEGQMISTKKIKQIVVEVLENNTGKVSISLNHDLQDDLLISKDDYEKIASDLQDAFRERESCGFDFYDIDSWNIVADICEDVVDCLECEGYIVCNNVEDV